MITLIIILLIIRWLLDGAATKYGIGMMKS